MDGMGGGCLLQRDTVAGMGRPAAALQAALANQCHLPTKATCHPPPRHRPQIILHPKWGSSVYPASMFAKAPLEAVQQAINEAVAELKDRL